MLNCSLSGGGISNTEPAVLDMAPDLSPNMLPQEDAGVDTETVESQPYLSPFAGQSKVNGGVAQATPGLSYLTPGHICSRRCIPPSSSCGLRRSTRPWS